MCVHASQKHTAADKSLNHLDIRGTLYYYANSTAASVDSLQVWFRNSCCPFLLTFYPLNPNYLVFFSKDELFKFTSNPQINKSDMPPCCLVSLRLYKKINTKTQRRLLKLYQRWRNVFVHVATRLYDNL